MVKKSLVLDMLPEAHRKRIGKEVQAGLKAISQGIADASQQCEDLGLKFPTLEPSDATIWWIVRQGLWAKKRWDAAPRRNDVWDLLDASLPELEKWSEVAPSIEGSSDAILQYFINHPQNIEIVKNIAQEFGDSPSSRGLLSYLMRDASAASTESIADRAMHLRKMAERSRGGEAPRFWAISPLRATIFASWETLAVYCPGAISLAEKGPFASLVRACHSIITGDTNPVIRPLSRPENQFYRLRYGLVRGMADEDRLDPRQYLPLPVETDTGKWWVPASARGQHCEDEQEAERGVRRFLWEVLT